MTISSDGLPEDDVTLNAAETEMILAIVNGDKSLYTSRRANATAAWSAPARIDILHTTGSDSAARLSADELSLYYGTTRNGASEDIWRSQRDTLTSAWKTPTVVPMVNANNASDRWYQPCGGKYVMISNRNTDNYDLYEGTEGQAPTRLALSSDGNDDLSPFLTPDCLILYWSTAGELYMATRATMADPWVAKGAAAGLSNANASEQDPWMSVDRKRMYYASNADGNEYDIYMATRDK